jgi:hypothetical protein
LTLPGGSGDGVVIVGAPATKRLNIAVAVLFLPSVAFTLARKTPAWDGVPHMRPSEAIFIPAGNPPRYVQVIGSAPPKSTTVSG